MATLCHDKNRLVHIVNIISEMLEYAKKQSLQTLISNSLWIELRSLKFYEVK